MMTSGMHCRPRGSTSSSGMRFSYGGMDVAQDIFSDIFLHCYFGAAVLTCSSLFP